MPFESYAQIFKTVHINGVQLAGTKSLKPLQGEEKGLWELRDVGLGWRIIIYLDLPAGRFVLLHGFRKKKKKEQQSDFRIARDLLSEYKKHGGCSDE